MSLDERKDVRETKAKKLAEIVTGIANTMDLSQPLETFANNSEKLWKFLKLLVIVSVTVEWETSVIAPVGMSVDERVYFDNHVTDEVINHLEIFLGVVLARAPKTKLGSVTSMIPSFVRRQFVKAVLFNVYNCTN